MLKSTLSGDIKSIATSFIVSRVQELTVTEAWFDERNGEFEAWCEAAELDPDNIRTYLGRI